LRQGTAFAFSIGVAVAHLEFLILGSSSLRRLWRKLEVG